jgi:hypothetical protein
MIDMYLSNRSDLMVRLARSFPLPPAPRELVPRSADELRVSAIVERLEQAWRAVAADVPELPEVAIVVASGDEGLKVKRWGHWAAARWVVPGGDRRGEILIAAERLGHGPIAVLGTLLHEAAHALAHVRGIADTSRQGRYHNERYRQLALELGLKVDKDETYGWTLTSLPDSTVDRYQGVLDALERGFRGYRALPPGMGPEEKAPTAGAGQDEPATTGTDELRAASGRLLVVCGCPTPRKLRVSKAIFELGPIDCGLCGQPFHTHP